MKQIECAYEAMTQWLCNLLGQAPAEVDCAGEFDYEGLHYYIFKYKRIAAGKWRAGVCGGYEQGDLNNCGHIYSKKEKYDEKEPVKQAIALIEELKDIWKREGEKYDRQKENAGEFAGVVLLNEAVFDKAMLLKSLKEDWHMEDVQLFEDEKKDALMLQAEEGEGFVYLLPHLMGKKQIYDIAEYVNREEAKETVKNCSGQLFVSFKRDDGDVLKAAKTQAKLISACCKQEGAQAVYTGSTILSTEQYLINSEKMKEGGFPFSNLVWIYCSRWQDRASGCTAGMRSLGFDEMEILYSWFEPQEVADMLEQIALYVIENNIALKEGDTLDIIPNTLTTVTRGRGYNVSGDSIKLSFRHIFPTASDSENNQ